MSLDTDSTINLVQVLRLCCKNFVRSENSLKKELDLLQIRQKGTKEMLCCKTGEMVG